MSLSRQLESFRFCILRVRYVPLDILTLYKHPSMILRGNLGNQLLNMGCLAQGAATKDAKKDGCKKDGQCQQPYDCLYGQLFQSNVPKDSHVLRHQQNAPRPFIFDFPEWILEDDAKAAQRVYNYSPDNPLEFNLILIGKAIAQLNQIIFALDKFGREGLYDKTRDTRVPIVLERIDSVPTLHTHELHTHEGTCEGTTYEGTCVFSGAAQKIFDGLQVLNAQDWLKNYADVGHADVGGEVELEFLSPTQLKYKKVLLQKPTMEAILRGLLRRVIGLSYVHCDTLLDIDTQAIISLSKTAVEQESRIASTAVGHYSKRQRQTVYLGGFYGTIRFDNVAPELWQLLRLGEIVHVGKHTVYGLGKMHMR